MTDLNRYRCCICNEVWRYSLQHDRLAFEQSQKATEFPAITRVVITLGIDFSNKSGRNLYAKQVGCNDVTPVLDKNSNRFFGARFVQKPLHAEAGVNDDH